MSQFSQFGHLVSGVAWTILGKIVRFAVNLVALAVIAREVGPSAYGVFALSWVVVGLLEIVVLYAPHDTLVQRADPTEGHYNASFMAAVGLSLVALVVMTLGADVLAGWLNGGPQLAEIVPWRAATLPINAAEAIAAVHLARASRFKSLAAAETAGSMAASVLGVVLALAGFGIWSLVAMELCRAIVITTLVFWIVRWWPGLHMRWSHFTDLLAFNASSWAAWGLAYVEQQLPRVLLGNALGPQAVGYFSLAQRLFDQVLDILLKPIHGIVQAGVSRSQDDMASVRKLAEGAVRMTSVIAYPMFLGLAAIGPVLIPVVFGPEWNEAILVSQILLLLGVRMSISMVQNGVLRGVGKPHWQVGIAIVSVSLTMALVTLALPYGLVAVVTAVVVRGYLVWPLLAWALGKAVDLTVREQARWGTGALVAAVVMGVLVYLSLKPMQSVLPDVVVLLVAGGLIVLLYWLMLRVFSPSAARVVERAAAAAARRDFGAVRAALLGGGS